MPVKALEYLENIVTGRSDFIRRQSAIPPSATVRPNRAASL
jgi:hypothetical protein